MVSAPAPFQIIVLVQVAGLCVAHALLAQVLMQHLDFAYPLTICFWTLFLSGSLLLIVYAGLAGGKVGGLASLSLPSYVGPPGGVEGEEQTGGLSLLAESLSESGGGRRSGGRGTNVGRSRGDSTILDDDTVEGGVDREGKSFGRRVSITQSSVEHALQDTLQASTRSALSAEVVRFAGSGPPPAFGDLSRGGIIRGRDY